MNAANWEQVKTIFHRAVLQPPGQRSGFVESACPDAEVLAEVKRLLADHDEAGSGFLSTTEWPAARLLGREPDHGVAASPDPRIGALLGGRYLIDRELGRG